MRVGLPTCTGIDLTEHLPAVAVACAFSVQIPTARPPFQFNETLLVPETGDGSGIGTGNGAGGNVFVGSDLNHGIAVAGVGAVPCENVGWDVPAATRRNAIIKGVIRGFIMLLPS
jgi:hypothetical protein